MKLKRYCVTVSDNWTPLRTFWTRLGAQRFYWLHSGYANVYAWKDRRWVWVFGANPEAPDNAR